MNTIITSGPQAVPGPVLIGDDAYAQLLEDFSECDLGDPFTDDSPRTPTPNFWPDPEAEAPGLSENNTYYSDADVMENRERVARELAQ